MSPKLEYGRGGEFEQTRPATPGGRPKWKQRLIGVLVFTAMLAIFMECGARVVFSVDDLRWRVIGHDDSSYRLEWIARHPYHTDWTGPFASYNPTRGWALKPGIRDMKVGDGTILNTNSKGVRGITEYKYARSPGTRRMVVLGDSFTFGSEVPDDDTFSRRLEVDLPNTEVVNLGIQAYGHDQMLLYLKEEGLKYHPDIVLLGFDYIDIYRNIWSFFAYAKPKFELDSGTLKPSNVPVPTPDRILRLEPYRPKAYDVLFILQDKIRWLLKKNEDQARAVTRALLDEIVADTRGIGATPVFVYLPVYEEIEPRFHGRSYPLTAASIPIADREQYLRGICQENDSPCLFLRSRFNEEVKKGVDFHPQGHWNAAAHRVASEEIAHFLVINGLIQTSRSSDIRQTRGRVVAQKE